MNAKRLADRIIQARLLVVDDDPLSRTQIKRLAGKFISDIRVAGDGVEGLEIWRSWRPNVVVTDIPMARMDGLVMSEAIRAEDPDAQIIVITAERENESLRRALLIGIERYIVKPLDMHLLADAIGKCVRNQQQLEELRLGRQVAKLTEALQEQLIEKERVEASLQEEKTEHLVLIQRLEDAHHQLLQSEKMASIGQLAAGVAHEINNPVGYVNSNLGTLQHYVEQLLALLTVYGAHEIELSSESRAEVDALKDDIDLAFLRQDVSDLLVESLGGLQRVRRIVQDLKDFSHVSDAEMQWANLEAGLESTLNVVWNELKYKADVSKDYGQLPEVECIPSQINQVFMKLLVNAAQSIEAHGKITVRTREVGDYACIEVSDTGSGIAPEIVNRIFDPFFTTKPVGSGTGLGLSVTHSIIQKHRGRVEVASVVGQGTTFRVFIPLRQTSGGTVGEGAGKTA